MSEVKTPARRNLATNYAVLFVGKVVTKLLTFVAMVLIARYLTEEDFGRLSFAFALASMFAVAAQAGLSHLNIREIARNKTHSSFISGKATQLRWINMLVVMLATSLIMLSLPQSEWPDNSGFIIILAGLGFAFATLGTTYTEIFQAFERMEFVAIVYFVTNTLNLLFVIGIMWLNWGLLEVGIAFTISNGCGWLVGYLYTGRIFPKPNPKVPLGDSLNHLKESWPFMASAIVAMIYWRTDTLTLTLMVGTGAAGIYNAAGRLTEGLLLIPSTYRESIYPTLSRSYIQDPATFNNIARRSYKYLTALSLPIAMGTSLLANPIIRFIYGDKYQGTEVVLAIIIWALATIFLREFTAGQLFSMNRQKSVLVANITAAVFNVVLNLTLIPYFSWVGASIAMVISAAISTGMNLWSVWKASPDCLKHISLIRSLISVAVMGISLWLAATYTSLHVLLLIPSGLILYMVVLFITGFFSHEEIRMIMGMLKRKHATS